MLEVNDLYPQFTPLVADYPLNSAPTTIATAEQTATDAPQNTLSSANSTKGSKAPQEQASINIDDSSTTVSTAIACVNAVSANEESKAEHEAKNDANATIEATAQALKISNSNTITALASQALIVAKTATFTTATTTTLSTKTKDANSNNELLPTSAHVRARSLASLQLRAKNAMRALLQQRKERILILCASSSIDAINTAVDLISEVEGPEPTVAYAPTKFELFGNDKEDGLVTACPRGKLNIVIMPCVHLIDHPKWLGMLEACIRQNTSLKLILTGDATDIAQLSMIWPIADNALHSDIVLEFSSIGALNTIAGLISYYAQQQKLGKAQDKAQIQAELTLAKSLDAINANNLHNVSNTNNVNIATINADTNNSNLNNDGAVTQAHSLTPAYEDLANDDLPLLPFTSEALTLLANYCCRLSGDRRYLGLPECTIQALIFAANSYAHHAHSDLVQRYHVLKALGAHDFRNNFLSESSLREHRDRQLLIATKGAVIGQINGLSVIETLGTSYEFGEPVRITATLRAGGEGDVIDIERKAELAGQIHAKAMMIINGFLTKEFGAEQPLPVSASLVFEQSYSEVDGDSASLTGLCAVISVLAAVPIRQDLAVTGAVDQFGDVQAVGGINEKIEGFYRVCRLHGFTNTQGVVIPRSCVQQLVLRPAVIKAVAEGKFHIFTVDHVTEAVKLLTSIDWGDNNTEGTIRYRINERLNNIVNNTEYSWIETWWQKLKNLFGSNTTDNKEHKS